MYPVAVPGVTSTRATTGAVGTTGFGSTVIAELPTTPPILALMSALPAPMPRPMPVELTLTTFVSVLNHVIARQHTIEPPAVRATAVNCALSPMLPVADPGVTVTRAMILRSAPLSISPTFGVVTRSLVHEVAIPTIIAIAMRRLRCEILNCILTPLAACEGSHLPDGRKKGRQA